MSGCKQVRTSKTRAGWLRMGATWVGLLGLSAALMGAGLLAPCIPVAPLEVSATVEPTSGEGATAVALSCEAVGGRAPYSFSWSSSPSVTIAGASLPNALANVTQTTTFTCEVTDFAGTVESATATVTITDAPVPAEPVANAGDDKTVEIGQVVTLNGSVTGGAPPVSFAWIQISGPGQSLSGASSATASVTGTAVGTAVFELTVTDALGRTSSDTVSVQVTTEPPDPDAELRLTVGTDTLVGDENDNLFDATLFFTGTGFLQTLGNADSLDGAGGTNTLLAQFIGGGTTTPAQLANIQILDLEVTDANAKTLNLLNADSVQSVTSRHAQEALMLTNLQTAPSAYTIINAGDNDFMATIAAAALSGDDDEATVTLRGVDGATVTLQPAAGANGYETINLVSEGALANVLGAISQGGGNSLANIGISGAQSIDLGAALPASVESVDASGASGNVTVDATNAPAEFSYAGGSGNDDLDLTGSFAVTQTLSGGDGEDTIRLASADAEAVTTAGDPAENISGFEILAITDAIVGDINLTLFNLDSTLLAEAGVDTTGGAVTITLASGDNLTIEADNAGANDLTLAVGGTGTSDSVSLTLDDASINTHKLALDGIETLNLTAIDGTTTLQEVEFSPTDPPGPTIGNALLNIAGSQDVIITLIGNAVVGSALTVNASALTGDLTVAESGSQITITGGSGDDMLVGSNADDAIDGGPGDDIIIGGPGADLLTGGPGSDEFRILNAGDEDGDAITDLTDDDFVNYNAQYLGGDPVDEFTAGTTVAALTAVDHDELIVRLSEAQTTAQLAADTVAIDAIVVAFDSTKGHMVIVADDDWSDGANRTVINVTNITTLADVLALADGTVRN